MEIKPIAIFHSPFSSKFGIPKQSGLVSELKGEIVFEPQYRDCDYIRGIDGFDYLWLVWEFSANSHNPTSPLVRPPLLGGNEKVGVFASRSPFRPNAIGLSSVRLNSVEWESKLGPILHVSGADLMNGTPIYDIKPYVEYADAHLGVRSGFVDRKEINRLEVIIPDEIKKLFSAADVTVLKKVLELDPRPHYHDNPQQRYGMPFGGRDIHFTVTGSTLLVLDAVEIPVR